MNYIDELKSWSDTLNVIEVLDTPITLAAGAVYTYDLLTADSLLGGHVYGMVSYDDPIYICWDHPIDAIDTNEPATLGVFGMALLWYLRRSFRRAIGHVESNLIS